MNSLARPGGNITGVVFQQLGLAQKQVDLLMQAFQGKTRLAALYDAQTFDQFTAAEQSARSLKGPTYRRLPGANDKCLLKSFLNVGNKFLVA
jgi:hypothetical protein